MVIAPENSDLHRCNQKGRNSTACRLILG